MDVQDFDTALTELETRVDRLRALYENWFRGYEKTEPSVARKDVERRVYGLRKELPRNTAMRFRYHQLYQRYTTLANYWQRTARQVEEGTYRLQLQRLRRRKDEHGETLAPRRRDSEMPGEPKSYELNLDETLNVGQLLDDFELDQLASVIDAPARHPELQGPPPRATSAGRPVSPSDLRSFGGLDGVALGPANDTQSLPEAKREDARGAPRRGVFSKPTGEAASAPVENRRREASGLDAAQAPAASAREAMASGASGEGGSRSMPMPRVERPRSSEAPRAASPAAASTGAAMPLLRARPPAPPGAVPPPPPTSRVSLPTQAAPGPALPAAPARAPGAIPPPPARVAPKAPPPPPRDPAKPAGAAAGPLNDQHMRRIYDEYVAARRKNNEGDVRYETLASSIQKMLPDLEKRHQGKRIDFEVVLKDGRVGLKPKAT
jgi:hypothetical protein